ncbi:MAG: hypothetical protein MUE44_28000 [Oscillatoriaceae cyanobacterium Prado104]|jgi:hypothetical protein|nr:hypothetical protein [Oscillatoriaceae cyanobacterium Prado104]
MPASRLGHEQGACAATYKGEYMAVQNADKVIEAVKQVTQDINSYEQDFLGFYKFIANSISQARERLEKLQSLDLIAIENLYQDYEQLEGHNLVLQKREREVVQVFIFGDFEQDAEITWEMSEILADFFVEYLIVPILNNVSYDKFQAMPSYFLEHIKDGVIVYEAKRSLHRDSAEVHS